MLTARPKTADDGVKTAIHHFCARARAKFETCSDFDTKRQFLVEHIDRVIYNRYKITVLGYVPVGGASGKTLPFRIEGQISKGAVREAASRQGIEARRKNHTSSVDASTLSVPAIEAAREPQTA